MKLVKLNDAVSMYPEPAFGTVKAEQRVMAISIDKETKNPYLGLAREITKSQGTPDKPGFIDESKLIIVESKDAFKWKKRRDLNINGIEKIINRLSGNDKYFIGLEDPDIINEGKTKHVYFTIAFKYKEKVGYAVYLGHAQGNSIEKLVATEPVLSPLDDFRGFKEVTIAPVNKKGYRINLSEAQLVINNEELSVTISAEGKDLAKPWKFKEIVLDPRKMEYDWCKGETSPMILFPKDFISLKNKDLVVGIINGREVKKIVNGEKIHGKFRPGLIVYNPETGKVPWISPECLFEDPDARTITFSSDFLRTGKKEGVLYAHVNDSFIRAYKIDTDKLKKLIPKEF
ncbi:MAG: hypothetical protein ACP5NZ_03650 [Nanobdellota archaeon]